MITPKPVVLQKHGLYICGIIYCILINLWLG